MGGTGVGSSSIFQDAATASSPESRRQYARAKREAAQPAQCLQKISHCGVLLPEEHDGCAAPGPVTKRAGSPAGSQPPFSRALFVLFTRCWRTPRPPPIGDVKQETDSAKGIPHHARSRAAATIQGDAHGPWIASPFARGAGKVWSAELKPEVDGADRWCRTR
jgi:hypothetical protein